MNLLEPMSPSLYFSGHQSQVKISLGAIKVVNSLVFTRELTIQVVRPCVDMDTYFGQKGQTWLKLGIILISQVQRRVQRSSSSFQAFGYGFLLHLLHFHLHLYFMYEQCSSYINEALVSLSLSLLYLSATVCGVSLSGLSERVLPCYSIACACIACGRGFGDALWACPLKLLCVCMRQWAWV